MKCKVCGTDMYWVGEGELGTYGVVCSKECLHIRLKQLKESDER